MQHNFSELFLSCIIVLQKIKLKLISTKFLLPVIFHYELTLYNTIYFTVSRTSANDQICSTLGDDSILSLTRRRE